VLGKYQSDSWIGSSNDNGEWRVAYHGTKEVNLKDILREGLRKAKGVRFVHGRGIYCTPNPRAALDYAMDYTVKVRLVMRECDTSLK
jgi:RNA:NAD 2'-phosphotransferase (TPT1/KptA family)